jgi:hypothetical protein
MKALSTILFAAAPLVTSGLLISAPNPLAPSPVAACGAGQAGVIVQITGDPAAGSHPDNDIGAGRERISQAPVGGRDPAWQASGHVMTSPAKFTSALESAGAHPVSQQRQLDLFAAYSCI